MSGVFTDCSCFFEPSAVWRKFTKYFTFNNNSTFLDDLYHLGFLSDDRDNYKMYLGKFTDLEKKMKNITFNVESKISIQLSKRVLNIAFV